MESIYLLKYGELSLKGAKRVSFEKRLCSNIKRKLRGIDLTLSRRKGRIYLSSDELNDPAVAETLARTFGLVAYARALRVEKFMPRIEEAACSLVERILHSAADLPASEGGRPGTTNTRLPAGFRFKIEARRSDKSFPLNSYEIACRLGDCLRACFPGLKVDLNRPDWILNIEIREAAYLYGPEAKAPGGLPLGCSGKGLLLLSGGIDSPVAGYLMGKRGLKIDAVYFHTPPFTSEQAKEKVEQLVERLCQYLTNIKLYVAPFTEVQTRIKERSKPEEITLLMRACMMKIAELIAREIGSVCLVTGESLGQVASQTPESIRFTDSATRLPVFRPLIGLDKEEIIRMARKIDTFETSILPYEDCCTIFISPHPLLKPAYERMVEAFNNLEIEDVLGISAQKAIASEL